MTFFKIFRTPFIRWKGIKAFEALSFDSLFTVLPFDISFFVIEFSYWLHIREQVNSGWLILLCIKIFSLWPIMSFEFFFWLKASFMMFFNGVLFVIDESNIIIILIRLIVMARFLWLYNFFFCCKLVLVILVCIVVLDYLFGFVCWVDIGLLFCRNQAHILLFKTINKSNYSKYK